MLHFNNMSGLQWLYFSWIDKNTVRVVKIFFGHCYYPPILITERNVTKYELPKMT